MNKISQLLLVVVLLAMAMTGCKSSQKATSKKTAQEVTTLKAVIESYDKEWSYFTCSGKIKLEGNMSLSSAFQLKMQRGNSIVVSLRPFLGIEMARAVIMQDSLVFIDKSSNSYASASISECFAQRINIETLQSLFLGRPFTLGSGKLKSVDDARTVTLDDGTIEIIPNDQIAPALYSFFTDVEGNISRIKVEGVLNNAIWGNYGEYTATDWGNVPSQVSLNIMAGNSITIEYNKGSMRWNQAFDQNINVPQGYRKVPITKYLPSIK